MIQIIRNHNYLNGLKFSFFEYLLVICVLAPFFWYYLNHAQWLYTIIASGIILNCATVSTFAFISILKGEPSVGFWKIYRDKDLRQKIQERYPSLSRETWILSITVLIPYWIFGTVTADLIKLKK